MCCSRLQSRGDVVIFSDYNLNTQHRRVVEFQNDVIVSCSHTETNRYSTAQHPAPSLNNEWRYSRNVGMISPQDKLAVRAAFQKFREIT